MPSYHFDCGNSSKGPIGFCARIEADNEAAAVERLRELLPEHVTVYNTTDEYIAVYLNGEAVTPEDIDDE